MRDDGHRPAPEAGLGLRGVVIGPPSDELAHDFGLRVEGPRPASICTALVELRDATGERRVADPGRRPERWLIEAAAGHLPHGILEVLRQEPERH